VDNLPAELVPELAELVASDPNRFRERVAIVLDVRAGDPRVALGSVLGALEGRGISPRVIFLEARDDVLHPALQRDTASPSTAARFGYRRLDRRRATTFGGGARDRGRDHRHVRSLRRSLRERVLAAIGATESPTASPSN
jgi:hypothetical protein